MRDKTTVWIEVDVRAVTDRGIMVYNGKRTSWIPKSQIMDYEDDLEIGVGINIELPEWLAIEKELV